MATRALSITDSAIDNDAPKPTWRRIGSLVVSAEEEYAGVDLTECGLGAYPEFTSSK